MNREEAKQLLPIIQALAEGKTVQIQSYMTGSWIDAPSDFMIYRSHGKELRIKPESKLRPWRIDEVPRFPFIVRTKLDTRMYFVVGKSDTDRQWPIVGLDICGGRSWSLLDAADLLVRVMDDGTERPCGVMEEA